MEESGIFHRRQAIILAADDQGGSPDLGDFVHQVKGIAGAEVCLQHGRPVPGKGLRGGCHRGGHGGRSKGPSADEPSRLPHVPLDCGKDIRVHAKPCPGSDKDQRRKAIRVGQSKTLRDPAPHGMAHEYRTPDAQGIQKLAHNVPVFRYGSIAVALALSVARQVHGHSVPPGGQVPDLETPVLLRPARPMYEHDAQPSPGVGAGIGARPGGIVKRQPLDRGEGHARASQKSRGRPNVTGQPRRKMPRADARS